MSTLAVVEEILRETGIPMSVREIVERAGTRLPSKSKTPDTVVARDLSMDLKKKAESSRFARTSPGRYTLRELSGRAVPASSSSPSPLSSPSSSPTGDVATPVLASAMRAERAAPLAARKPLAASDRDLASRQGP